MNTRNVCIWALAIGLLTSCDSDDDEVVDLPGGDYETGLFVTNEGPFNNGSGTVSFISEDFLNVEHSIFNKVNNEDLGNIVQSMSFDGDLAYIVANVSNKINIVNRDTFEKQAEITEGLNNPRYFVAVDGTGYVSNWGDTADETDDFIAVIDLVSNTVVSTISVPLGPERLLVNGNALYVANSGAFSTNNQISVINTSSNSVTTTITVGDMPNSMQFDSSGNLWVLASGNPGYLGETGGALSKINTTTFEVVNLDFESTQHPGSLGIDQDMLYYQMGGAVYKMDPSDDALPTEEYLSGLSFYSMTVNEGKLYGTDAKDYASNGTLSIYDIATKDSLTSLTMGIIPGGVYFNE
ncbi:DUF5074 domain-containing protein [uncultured Kriegella sp.]|uniref:YncE family protein n=1 Tax=uncultured Kriegella sp. TaxID=1798910 RepID=UPI0030DC62C2|tara:strand:- start:444841 stop:445896 length:1056 start_codon:yes stop_codon:yes gene_type:complete